ncbi:hypothetical protein AB0M43_03135 [Longispora sp. NPDC051575]|uniref:hypothetical protein n=1 Tax=Longispora sp. NPDC051575 TaxID=3154943 RepID=UPI0034225693
MRMTATLETVTDFPVPARKIIRFSWQTGPWFDVFQRQVLLIQDDLARARAGDRLVAYLSCPVSPRGGGHPGTNVAVAGHTARRLAADLGERFHVLNPAAYQLESAEGRTTLARHAADLGLDLAELLAATSPKGGDYMRMWTRVLVEDDGEQLGARFDAMHLLGPSDVRDFFLRGAPGPLIGAIEEYFARRYALDPDFRADFEAVPPTDPQWEARRTAFVRYYAIRAGAAYSLGSHDEWNIAVRLNAARRASTVLGPGAGQQIALVFDGRQVPPGSAETETSPGYEVV